MSNVAELLRELVAINSISSVSNRPVIDFVKTQLSWPVTEFTYRDADGVEKVNCVFGPCDARLALVCHTDTVPFDEKLPARSDGEKVWGRGSCDTKGFLAAAIGALNSGDTGRNVSLVLTADEEIGCVGAKHLLARRAISPRFAIVGEPTSLQPIRAGKGYALAEVIVAGREAHSAFPVLGVSAISRAARLIQRIEEFGRELEQQTDSSFDPAFTTINIGQISGGTAKNIIPGECRFLVEWRPIPSQEPRDVADTLTNIVGDLGFVEVRRAERGFATPGESRLVELLEKEAGRSAGAVSFGTEAPQLAALGAETVVFGPGSMSVAHTSGEFAPVAELQRCSAILRKVIAELVGDNASTK
ncbi:MAG: Acetylornithine deacetylase [uncultured Chthoniobacterales bacterium]|uniref:Acetylornithine deacetylase n=1 Tax=uncultured Chthoniobacterales bacterium TaxID=1836801 RepID=A0A6J4J3T7_9BACT|nr:MAG: Acetylornithine deacetylase [uncultured Chthoniobacterales bacterium]